MQYLCTPAAFFLVDFARWRDSDTWFKLIDLGSVLLVEELEWDTGVRFLDQDKLWIET